MTTNNQVVKAETVLYQLLFPEYAMSEKEAMYYKIVFMVWEQIHIA